MAAEEDSEVRFVEEFFRQPDVSRVDRLVEGAERFKGERMGESDVATGADGGYRFDDLRAGSGRVSFSDPSVVYATVTRGV